ncbi:uncharacterized protein A4U43_C02F6740 [Asparagus officinalis]|uniref:C2H2-type domain-containing protein n=1 Tax=Asparagus officinalis TaxID=4686 RepID=A0A5P1FKJ1_ASPOF|nr:uncharacterized zinc finger protein At4g06634-like [Asparagus officinalis]ONK77459.1 uncharacterized protein A4U43_C02F6740 [Asparagus officinalis]
MGDQSNHRPFVRRSVVGEQRPAVRWVKDWVPQDISATGKRIFLLKWVKEDTLKSLKESFKEPEPEEPKPEPATEILFLCRYKSCNKAYINEAQYRKHAHVHGKNPGCGKKFGDSSKLKRHHLVHTGVKDYVCPHEGCGRAFNLSFNLRTHMKLHSQEHCHVCPYQDCGKRYTQEYKLKNHIKGRHEKAATVDMINHSVTADKLQRTVKARAVHGAHRPYVCPYEDCGKNYIHKYKLNLHLRNQHPGHNREDVYPAKGGVAKNSKSNKPDLLPEMSPSKLQQKGSPSPPMSVDDSEKRWPNHVIYEHSEETEEELENIAGDDDEETEDEECGLIHCI